MKKNIITAALCFLAVIGLFEYYAIFVFTKSDAPEYRFQVVSGNSAGDVGVRLTADGVIGSQLSFRLYLKVLGKDTNLKTGDYVVTAPLTMARIIDVLSHPGTEERTITIIPGWTLRDIAAYFVKEGIAKNEEEVYALAGHPAISGRDEATPRLYNLGDYPYITSKPARVSIEGYLRPDTFRVYKNATIEDILHRILLERGSQIPQKWYKEAERQGRTMHEIFTMASILEKEARNSVDKKMIADLFWRRLDKGWALQSDATVHYVSGTPDSVFTSDKERASDNLYNTYKYSGLPPGPISTPSIESIEAALYPTKNEYWYFLTTLDTGEVIFSKTIEEQTKNVYRYLR